MARTPAILRPSFTAMGLALSLAMPVSALAGPAMAESATTEPSPKPADEPRRERPHRNRGLGMTVVGFGLFASSYLITLGIGVAVVDSGNTTIGVPLMIPVAGPFIAGARSEQTGTGVAIGLTGAFQVVGLIVGTVGAIRLGKSRARLRAWRDDRVATGPGGLMVRF